MKILARKGKHPHFDGTEEYNNQLAKPSQVKRLGEYLAFDKNGKFMDVRYAKYFNNAYKIGISIMYQVPLELRQQMRKYKVEFGGKEEDIYMRNIKLNIATYRQFIRVLVLLDDDTNETLGFLKLTNFDTKDLPECKKEIRDYIVKKIEDRYDAYEVMV